MYKKYRGLSDDEIVFAYKIQSDDDLETELLNRYKMHAKKLAAELYVKFKFLYQVEFEDIYCIVIACVFTSAKNFKKGMKNFFMYWRSSATREVYLYVGQFSSLDKDNAPIFESASNGEERNYINILKQNEISLVEDYPIMSDIVHVIDKDKTNFDQIDKSILYLYVEGYSLYEIATELNMKYATVRRRLAKVKDKISDILFNQ